MFPMQRQPIAVAVEYTAKGQRTIRTFPNEYLARRFYVRKDKEGASPKVIAIQKPPRQQDFNAGRYISTVSESFKEHVMTSETTNVETTPATETKAKTVKKVAKKAAPAKATKKVATKKVAKKVAKKAAAKKAPKEKGESSRISKWIVPILKILNKNPRGKTRNELLEALDTQDFSGALVKHADLLERIQEEGSRGFAYVITSAGKKFLAANS